jgi:hypothetical protein
MDSRRVILDAVARKTMREWVVTLVFYSASATIANAANLVEDEKVAAPDVTTGEVLELGSAVDSELTVGSGAGMTVTVAA